MRHKNDQKDMNNLLVENLLGLPEKILKFYYLDDLSQMVLHHISCDDCFGLDKSAYFIDNPDFDHLQGVAGFSKDESVYHNSDFWKDPANIKDKIKDTSFLNKIRRYLDTSFARKKIDFHNSREILELGNKIGIKHPDFCCWEMKHGNYGLLIFESKSPLSVEKKKILKDVAPLLSFCPIVRI